MNAVTMALNRKGPRCNNYELPLTFGKVLELGSLRI
jgi:hypothetical protein